MAINGPAAGFGITITLPATIRIACSSAKISFAFARRGLVMEAASSYFLPRLVGMSRALHLVTTGATYIASDPLLSQLFSELLPTPGGDSCSSVDHCYGDYGTNVDSEHEGYARRDVPRPVDRGRSSFARLENLPRDATVKG